MALILLTNDDGIGAEGIRCLEEFLVGLAEIKLIVPDRERSAVSHGLTIHTPLEITKIDPRHYLLNGTPADCIIYFLNHLTNVPPDIVISGINHGANLGDDIMYSGTVAGAREASRHGIASLAVSQAFDDKPISFREGARFVRSLVKTWLQKMPRPGTCLNINVPAGDVRGVTITRQGCRQHFPQFDYMDLLGEPAIAPESAERDNKSELTLDFCALEDHNISITPLQRDQTDYAMAESLCREMPYLFHARRLPRMGLIK